MGPGSRVVRGAARAAPELGTPDQRAAARPARVAGTPSPQRQPKPQPGPQHAHARRTAPREHRARPPPPAAAPPAPDLTHERLRTTTKRCCVPERTQRRRRRLMGYGNPGRPPRQRGARLVPPSMRAWLTPPHGRRHKPHLRTSTLRFYFCRDTCVCLQQQLVYEQFCILQHAMPRQIRDRPSRSHELRIRRFQRAISPELCPVQSERSTRAHITEIFLRLGARRIVSELA